MKAITRLFADMGDSYVELIATGTYLNIGDKVHSHNLLDVCALWTSLF